MNPTERLALILARLFALLSMLGTVDIFATSASTAGVVLFVVGMVGVVVATAAVVDAEQQHANRGRP